MHKLMDSYLCGLDKMSKSSGFVRFTFHIIKVYQNQTGLFDLIICPSQQFLVMSRN